VDSVIMKLFSIVLSTKSLPIWKQPGDGKIISEGSEVKLTAENF
jgi:hypothetical protein